MRRPDNAASEGIAIQHRTGIHADYECICPICGEESGVDDLGAEYECQVCGNIVIFREENIKIAESGQESIKAMSQEEHKAIHRAEPISPERLAEMMETAKIYANFPCGVSLNEISAKDIYAALQELAEYRQSELRPAEKFLTNTLDQQLQHIEQEFNEVIEALHEYQRHEIFQNCFFGRSDMIQKTWEHLKEELTDLKTSCTTMEAIMGMDAADRRAEVRKVNAKNERRNYFDRT